MEILYQYSWYINGINGIGITHSIFVLLHEIFQADKYSLWKHTLNKYTQSVIDQCEYALWNQ